jgi:hypothetical protein
LGPFEHVRCYLLLRDIFIMSEGKDALMDRSSYENVKGQVGHCGLWCGSCIIGNGLLAEMTAQYERVACGHGVHKWVLKEKGEAFVEALGEIKKVPICPGCLKGGGDDTCRMRECTKQRGLLHCDECDAGDGCPHMKAIESMREGGKAAGMIAATNPRERENLFTGVCRTYFDDYPGILFNDLTSPHAENH